VEWIILAQNREKLQVPSIRLVNLQISYNAGKLLTSWGTFTFSGRFLLDWISRF